MDDNENQDNQNLGLSEADSNVTEISTEMKRAYLNYAMSVIVARALPDVRDGLKPVHRRILYAMHKLGLTFSSRYSKSAKVVGEVLGKYHPHGDSPVYEALVRMAQTFSMRYPLVRGQGNFGSVDGDPPAAMRYTEVKLEKISEEMLSELKKETVPWVDNFDGTLKEPIYLPARLPNLLLMGAEGIAVGMATKIPPHNLTEVIDASTAMIDKTQKVKNEEKPEKEPEILDEKLAVHFSKSVEFEMDLDTLMTYIPGPDFPTGGLIYGEADIRNMYATGRGSILVRAKIEEENLGMGKSAIIVKELPYQVNKANLVTKIAHLVRDKKIVGISDLRDESDREGIRVVIELKRDAVFKKVLNNLYKHTDLQTSFPTNMVVLVEGVPQTLSLKTVLEHFLKHRIEMVVKSSQYDLIKAQARAHILEGLLIALDNIDEVVDIIKKSKNEEIARQKLMSRFSLSQIQAQAILDMQLKRLTALERENIEEELRELQKIIDRLTKILKDVMEVLKVVKGELVGIKEKYGDPRKTKIFKHKPGAFSEEELIPNEEVIVTMTKEGYIKQVPLGTFKLQKRGGKGVSGFSAKEGDDVYFITSAHTHDSVLFFTDTGKVFQTRIWEIPRATRASKGKAVVNVVGISADEKITSILTYSQEQLTKRGEGKQYIFMCTNKGTVKKTPLKDFANIRTSGIRAIRLSSGDLLQWVTLTDGECNITLATRQGKAIMFNEKDVRSTGRDSMGVRGITLSKKADIVTSMDAFPSKARDKKLIVLTERGKGKLTKVTAFRVQKRGGMGVRVAGINEKTGPVVFTQIVEDDAQTLMITSRKGQVVKIPVSTIPTLSREAKGVILMRFSDSSDKIVSATFI